MALPSKTQISDAVESGKSFLSPILQGYRPEQGILGPNLYSGGFCIVFPIDNGSNKKALRVWHTEIDDIKNRYKLISDDIVNLNLQFLSNPIYVEQGLLVDNNPVDVVVMDWIDGLALKDYIKDIINSQDIELEKRNKLDNLADNLLQIFQIMHFHHFAHGDLQHDNIIITQDGNVHLIDYDNFYSPSLGDSFFQTTTGYSGYQHPLRNHLSFPISSEKDDYFAELIIYLSVKALAEDMSLWKIVESNDDLSMLFTMDDYTDIQHSKTFHRVKLLNDEIAVLCHILEDYLKVLNLSELCSFDIILDRLNVKFDLSESKIRIGKESSVLSWDVKSAEKITIYEGSEILQDNAPLIGNITVKPAKTITYKLLIEDSKGKQQTKETTLYVFEEASISFDTDKQYVFPSIPFTLSWNVRNAKDVELDGLPVNHIGSKMFVDGVAENTTFTFKVTDEFGTQEKSLEIKMLPVPMITELIAPAPKIEKTVNVHVVVPQYKAEVNIPDIEIKEVNLSAPFNLSLEGMGVEIKNPEIVEPKFELESPQESRMNKVRTLFNKARAFVFTKNYERINKSKSVIQKQ